MTYPVWTLLHPRATEAHLGLLPTFLNTEDPRSAAEQIDTAYPFGGWQPFKGFKPLDGYRIKYPGDPAYSPIASCKLRDEVVVLYPHSWVAIWQGEDLISVSRID